MRIWLVNGFGQGARTYARNLSKALSRRGHDVLWLCDPFGKGPGTDSYHPRLEAITMGRSKLEYHPLSYTILRSLRIRRLQETVSSEFRPDVVHAVDPAGVLLSPGGPTPLVATIHHPAVLDRGPLQGPFPRIREVWNRLPGALHIWAERVQAKRSNLIVTVSEWSRNALAAAYGMQKDRLVVVRNGIDPLEFPTLVEPLEPQNPNGTIRILHVGRNAPRKRIPFLMEAFAEAHNDLPALRLRIVGADDATLRARARRLHISEAVSWLGPASQERLYMEFGKAQIFASASALEGFSYVTLEAMTAGLPVVVPCNSAFPELVTEGVEGMMYSTDSISELASCLRILGEDDSLRERMGRRGREAVDAKYNLEAFAAGIEAAYREALTPASGEH